MRLPRGSQVSLSDMATLRDLLESGQVKPVVERCYPLADVAAALGYLGEGHAQGKFVVRM